MTPRKLLRWHKANYSRTGQFADNPATEARYFLKWSTKSSEYVLTVVGDEVGRFKTEAKAKEFAEKLAQEAAKLMEIAHDVRAEEETKLQDQAKEER